MTAHSVVPRSVATDEGRVLTFDVSGDPDGCPVFLLHGTPGSRRGPKPRGIVLYRLGVRLICYDRPGYGGSGRHEHRSVRDAADDVQLIAGELGLDRFAVVGRSGGGPHALAVAAELSDRVSSTAVLVSLAPADAAGLDWYHGMNGSNIREYGDADKDAKALLESLTAATDEAQRDPRRFIALIQADLSAPDKRVVGDVTLRRLLLATYREALSQGPDGWIDDVLALRKPWGIDFARITSNVLLWHGADDRFSPADHTLWLGEQMPRAHVTIEPGIGHFGAVEVLPEVLSWVTQPAAAFAGYSFEPDWMSRTGPADQSLDRAAGLPAAP